MDMKTTTNACKNQKFTRKKQEEIDWAIETVSFSVKFFSMIHWTLILSKWELSVLW